jgi:hypothetical protein
MARCRATLTGAAKTCVYLFQSHFPVSIGLGVGSFLFQLGSLVKVFTRLVERRERRFSGSSSSGCSVHGGFFFSGHIVVVVSSNLRF